VRPHHGDRRRSRDHRRDDGPCFQLKSPDKRCVMHPLRVQIPTGVTAFCGTKTRPAPLPSTSGIPTPARALLVLSAPSRMTPMSVPPPPAEVAPAPPLSTPPNAGAAICPDWTGSRTKDNRSTGSGTKPMTPARLASSARLDSPVVAHHINKPPSIPDPVLPLHVVNLHHCRPGRSRCHRLGHPRCSRGRQQRSPVRGRPTYLMMSTTLSSLLRLGRHQHTSDTEIIVSVPDFDLRSDSLITHFVEHTAGRRRSIHVAPQGRGSRSCGSSSSSGQAASQSPRLPHCRMGEQSRLTRGSFPQASSSDVSPE
jgi:hypothetical protein